MNKAGISAAYYYLTSVDSVPKQWNIGNSWTWISFFLPFFFVSSSPLFLSSPPLPSPSLFFSSLLNNYTIQVCYHWYKQIGILQTKFNINIFFCIERPSPNKRLTHFYLLPRVYICPGHVTSENTVEMVLWFQLETAGVLNSGAAAAGSMCPIWPESSDPLPCSWSALSLFPSLQDCLRAP